MKEEFFTKRFNSEALAMIAKAEGILNDYERKGYDLSLRQLYYQFVSRNWLPNTERSYKNLGVLVSDARMAGLLDWDMIKDRGRTRTANSHWDSPADILDVCSSSFQIDKWHNQSVHVEVMVEKQALEGVLQPVCAELDIAFQSNKGYSSSSALYECGKRLGRIRDQQGKDIVILYLGDHDPSGLDMTRDIEDRLQMFSRGGIEVQRLALNMDQIDELNPPENPAKITDSRAEQYIAEFGESSWELDAIEPDAMANMVRNAVENLRDPDAWEDAENEEGRMKEELKRMAANYRRDH